MSRKTFGLLIPRTIVAIAIALTAVVALMTLTSCARPLFHSSSDGTTPGLFTSPFAYHDLYANIASATIVVKGTALLRGEDGRQFEVPVAPQTIDLLKLNGQSTNQLAVRGIQLKLSQVQFPDDASQLEVAEIELQIERSEQNRVTLVDNRGCGMAVPARLLLYTSAPTPVSHDDYIIKVAFQAIEGITFRLPKTSSTARHGDDGDTDHAGHDSENVVEQTLCADSDKAEALTFGSASGSHCEHESNETLTCELSNQRYRIVTLVRFQDEF